MTVVGRGGKELISVTPLGVENLSLRSLAMREGSKVDMVPRACAHGMQERAVHPGHERAVEFSRTAEAVHVVLDAGDEDVLHLQIAAWMQQRRGVHETLRCAARQVKTDVVRHLRH